MSSTESSRAIHSRNAELFTAKYECLTESEIRMVEFTTCFIVVLHFDNSTKYIFIPFNRFVRFREIDTEGECLRHKINLKLTFILF